MSHKLMLGSLLAVTLVSVGCQPISIGPYRPQRGDIVFQSRPHDPFVEALEGATLSRYSQCGIVDGKKGNWKVIESYKRVRETPFKDWIQRGRDARYAVYRLRDTHQVHVDKMIESAQSYLGRPDDMRYELDDHKIYSSELVYKSYKQASGHELGLLERYGDLNWQPYINLIRELEGGTVPVDRYIISPRSLSKAPQLQKVFSKGM